MISKHESMLDRIVINNLKAVKTFTSSGKWFLLEAKTADMYKGD